MEAYFICPRFIVNDELFFIMKQRLITAKEAAAKIAELTGIARSANQTRLFLKKCGMRWRVTGVLPAKADPDKQEDFKKNTGAQADRSSSRETRRVLC